MTSTAATNVVGHLVQVGLVEEMTGRSYGRVLGARAVMEILETI